MVGDYFKYGNGGGNMRLKIKGKLMLAIISMIVIFSIIVNLIIYYQFNNYVSDGVLTNNSKLSLQLINEKYPGDWKIDNNKLYKGDKLINDNFEIVDLIKNDANVECTIFLKDIRVTTTIIKDGNKRATGTKADEKVITKVISENSEYMGTVNILNQSYKTLYIPLKATDGSIIGMFFIGIQQQIINKQINNIIIPIVFSTLFLVITMIIIIIIFTKKIIINPINYIKAQLKVIAEGDLSKEIEKKYLNKKDEFGDMSVSIKFMQDSIKNMIKSIHESSINTDGQSNTLASISEEIASASSNVAMAIQNISNGVDSQTGNLNEISEVLNMFGKGLDDIKNSIENVDVSTKGMGEKAKESSCKMIEISQSVNCFSDAFKGFIGEVKGLCENINQISEITILINNIAEQTNLLALNAAIEAARAGDAGRGFNVVAEEIRKLSVQTKISSEEISKLIERVSFNTNEMIGRTSVDMNNQLSNQANVINRAIESFKQIIDEINKIFPKMDEVNLSTQKISGEKELILKKVRYIASISQDVAATFEEILASSQEMNSSTEEVAAVAQSLNAMTRDMIKKIDNFKIV